MDIRFWVDAFSTLLQVTAAFYMTYRYTEATHRWLRTAVSATILLVIYLLTDGMLLVRTIASCAVQVALALMGTRIPTINAAIYTVLSIFMMFVAEFPLDLALLMAYPDFVSFHQLPLSFILVFRLLATPYFIFCYYIDWLICDKIFHRYTAKNVTRYLPLFVFQVFILSVLVVINGLALAANANIIPFAICSTVIVVFLIVIDYMLMHTFEQLNQLHQLELDKQQTELLLKSEAENYARLQEQAQIIRRLRHDMINQLQAVRILLDGGHTDTAVQQLDSYFASVKQWGNAVFSGNAVIDAIINAKYYLIQDSEIRFHYEGQLPAHIGFDSAGLSSIVSNLLDNAINACNKLPEEQRSIDFSVLLHGSELLISCKNPSTEQSAPVPKAPDLSSEHGWGLTILQQLADRYSGRMVLRNEAGTIQATLWIPLAYEKELAH